MLVNEQNYVDEAERVIKALIVQEERNARNMPLVTTSKLRNLLAMSADIYNEVINQKEDKLSEDICARKKNNLLEFLYFSVREIK